MEVRNGVQQRGPVGAHLVDALEVRAGNAAARSDSPRGSTSIPSRSCAFCAAVSRSIKARGRPLERAYAARPVRRQRLAFESAGSDMLGAAGRAPMDAARTGGGDPPASIALLHDDSPAARADRRGRRPAAGRAAEHRSRRAMSAAQYPPDQRDNGVQSASASGSRASPLTAWTPTSCAFCLGRAGAAEDFPFGSEHPRVQGRRQDVRGVRARARAARGEREVRAGAGRAATQPRIPRSARATT